jgi:hypothetical protein
MKERFRPQPENPKQNAPESGAGSLGIPPPEPEQKPQGGDGKSPEHQPLPSVWDILERRMSLDELKPKGHWVSSGGRIEPPLPEELEREERELNRLSRELREKGTPRDRLILELGSYGRIRTRGLSQEEEFRQFRSEVEQLSDEEIAVEIRRQENITGFAFSPGVGLSEIIFKYQKGKQEQRS